MASKKKLRKTIRKLERRNIRLIAEVNAARARAGEWYEAAQEAAAAEILDHWPSQAELEVMFASRGGVKLDG